MSKETHSIAVCKSAGYFPRRRRLPSCLTVRLSATWWVVIASLMAADIQAADAGAEAYERSVEPILRRRCLGCHGPEKQKGGLRVDRRASLLEGGASGDPAVIPGDGAVSPLIERVSATDRSIVMPPEGEPLSVAEVRALRDWIDAGLQMPEEDPEVERRRQLAAEHWAFRPLGGREVPPSHGSWATNEIDRFVISTLTRAGLKPSPPTNPHALARRLFLVMLGVPPTPEELGEFLDDRDPRAYERLVDRVLADPRYGETWAQHWLDVIRFAETWGYETNSFRPQAYHFRDWVIAALNDDMPYDRFIFEQLAGDTVGADAATGFLVAGPANLPGQIGRNIEAQREARQDALDEVIKTAGASILGLTVGCARCHDHKFDPIAQTDYYALQAVFAGLDYGHRRLRGPEDRRWAAQVPQFEARLEVLEEQLRHMQQRFSLRPAVRRQRTEETFAARTTQRVRMRIDATGDGGRVQLHEFEVWTASGEVDAGGAQSEAAVRDPSVEETTNVALAVHGAKASASSFALENQTRHPDNLIDGKRIFPWKTLVAGPAWLEIELARPTRIDRIAWQGDGGGLPADYAIEVEQADGQWLQVAHSIDRLPHASDRRDPGDVRLAGVPAAEVEGIFELVAEKRAAQAERDRLAAGPQVFAGTFQRPEETFRLHRGDPMQRRELVAANTLAVLGSLQLGMDAPDVVRRTSLARHVIEISYPLTARVIVNRIWQHHFGLGIVGTPSDFGLKGGRPTHPELLDWLARELLAAGWSLKHVHRMILLSSTFRQSSSPRDSARTIDADGRLLWRFPPRRLTAEAIRDAMLAVSGELESQMHGEGFNFFQKAGGVSDFLPKESFTAREHRRMVYATKIRMESVDVFGAFDCPDAGQMAPLRSQSVTPIQALNLFNSAFVREQARSFARRVQREVGDDAETQVARAFALALARQPCEAETARLVDLAADYGLEQVCRVLLNTNEFIFIE